MFIFSHFQRLWNLYAVKGACRQCRHFYPVRVHFVTNGTDMIGAWFAEGNHTAIDGDTIQLTGFPFNGMANFLAGGIFHSDIQVIVDGDWIIANDAFQFAVNQNAPSLKWSLPITVTSTIAVLLSSSLVVK